MKLKNVKNWSKFGPESYLYSCLGVFIAFYIRYLLHPFLQSDLPMTFFIANTIIIGMVFGYGPSILSAILSVPVAFFWFVPPFDSFDLPTAHDSLVFLSYIVVTTVVVGIIEWLQRARYRAELIAKVSDSRYLLLAQASYSLKLNQVNESTTNAQI